MTAIERVSPLVDGINDDEPATSNRDGLDGDREGVGQQRGTMVLSLEVNRQRQSRQEDGRDGVRGTPTDRPGRLERRTRCGARVK